ncbi:hypothetical protein ASPWEDRAFT_582797 [Aspergillus wentii DTO 134E9]|uniref:Transcription factor domain-containing protein n=1 Tax=Aspergillus wentii DTO 134E9 TaxID=1073089 RepID=A0A1L9RHQ7_ASPWE|nr:uncharacterized protein ASPWEDRAFT_582797 [Aspergillus wentii DTO 134E9]KAI9925775.1 hypothetical protein MW887_005581 [Aspergillus wentii]OJJ34444.1 hypothetical protein ASPWEDRAFT_582797 [Aspergillus wentii DTO 134E9]
MPNKNGFGGRTAGVNFINARPSSESEKLKIQRLVRAHVGKWISDQTKDRSSPPGADDSGGPDKPEDSASRITVLEDEEGGSPSSSSVKSSRTSPSSSSSNTSSSVTHAASCDHWQQNNSVVLVSRPALDTADKDDENYHHYDHDDPSPQSDSRPIMSHPPLQHVERISSNVFDPFHSYPSSLPPEAIHSCESYCLSVLWPALTPRSENEPGPIANANWFPLSLRDPTLFTAFLLGSLSHQRVQWLNGTIPAGAFGPREQRLLNFVEMETIKLINLAVADPTRALSDAVILSVIAVAHNRAEERDYRKFPDPPFTAPLRRLQWLEVYGSQTANLVHVQGLIQIIMLRGGLEYLETPGLAHIVSFSDAFTASTLLSPPMFPFMPLQKSRRGCNLQTLLGFSPIEIERGFGRLREVGLTVELAEILHSMHVYITIVEEYLCGKKTDLSLLCDQRNLIIHTLSSIPAADQLNGVFINQTHKVVYEACRLAALIYGVGVVFPLPAQSTPLARLAGLLRATLQSSHFPSFWPPILLWVLTLGGISAENTSERSWFVDALGQAAAQSRIYSWVNLRAVLGMMLWYDRACDLPGQNLWREVAASFARNRI